MVAMIFSSISVHSALIAKCCRSLSLARFLAPWISPYIISAGFLFISFLGGYSENLQFPIFSEDIYVQILISNQVAGVLPKCLIYRELIQSLIANRGVCTSEHPGLLLL